MTTEQIDALKGELRVMADALLNMRLKLMKGRPDNKTAHNNLQHARQSILDAVSRLIE